MAIPKRHAFIPGTYFVTSRTWENRLLFQKPASCQLFLDTLIEYRQRAAYLLHAYVLMPDHFHILLTPGPQASLEHAVKLIKGGSARKIGLLPTFRFPVWQRGFSDHRIRDTGDYQLHIAYIEQNPVRKRLAPIPSEYPWSSSSGQVTLDDVPQGLKPLKWGTPLRHD